MAIINGTAASEALADNTADISSTLNANWSLGDDAMFGGINNDTYNVNSVGDQVFENANQGIDRVVSRVTSYTLGNNVEHLTLDNTPTLLVLQPNGSFAFVPSAVNGTGNSLDNQMIGNDRDNTLSGLDGNDSLYGNNGNDTLNGGNGNDYLSGGSGDDTLNGGSGNDTMNGGTGNDTMAGGFGNDTYYVDSVGDVVVEGALFGGTDHVYSYISDTLDANVENMTLLSVAGAVNATGNASANVLNGNGLNNTLSGLAGNDTLNGNAGNDTLLGGDGNDTLNGGTGNDSLNGGAGNDTLNGGTGLDFLTGSLGNDNFVFSTRGAADADTITDFSHALDTIVLSNSLDAGLGGALNPGVLGLAFSGGAVAGNQLAGGWFFKGVGATGNNAGALSGIYVNTQDGNIWYNATTAAGGDSHLIGRVSFAAAGSLDATDFVYGA
jgi:Ca2+-binding RTX toxin-like protein